MDRRNFLKSIGATALIPAIPTPAFSLGGAAAGSATAAFTDHTYEWAKMIVRAHDKCNIGLLQRSLHIDTNVAQALKSALIKNGVVQSQANAYGIHKATEPLYREAFISVSDVAEKIEQKALDYLEQDGEAELETQGEDTIEEHHAEDSFSHETLPKSAEEEADHENRDQDDNKNA